MKDKCCYCGKSGATRTVFRIKPIKHIGCSYVETEKVASNVHAECEEDYEKLQKQVNRFNRVDGIQK